MPNSIVTRSGFHVSRQSGLVAVSMNGHPAGSTTYLPFVNASFFIGVDEARELAAAILEMAEDEKEQPSE